MALGEDETVDGALEHGVNAVEHETERDRGRGFDRNRGSRVGEEFSDPPIDRADDRHDERRERPEHDRTIEDERHVEQPVAQGRVHERVRPERREDEERVCDGRNRRALKDRNFEGEVADRRGDRRNANAEDRPGDAAARRGICDAVSPNERGNDERERRVLQEQVRQPAEDVVAREAGVDENGDRRGDPDAFRDPLPGAVEPIVRKAKRKE